MYVYVYIYIYRERERDVYRYGRPNWGSLTPNPPTNIADVGGFDSSIILI